MNTPGGAGPWPLAARTVVVLLALVVLVLAAGGALTATEQGVQAVHPSRNAGYYQNDLKQKAQMDSLRRQLTAKVPAGSTVFIPTIHIPGVRQRVIEFATFDGIVVLSTEAGADYVVSAVSSPSSPGGLDLSVRRNG